MCLSWAALERVPAVAISSRQVSKEGRSEGIRSLFFYCQMQISPPPLSVSADETELRAPGLAAIQPSRPHGASSCPEQTVGPAQGCPSLKPRNQDILDLAVATLPGVSQYYVLGVHFKLIPLLSADQAYKLPAVL